MLTDRLKGIGKSCAALLLFGVCATSAWAIPPSPFNEYMEKITYPFGPEPEIHVSRRLCAKEPWPELAAAAAETGVYRANDFIEALRDLYCRETFPDHVQQKRFRAVVDGAFNSDVTAHRSSATPQHAYGLESPRALWIRVRERGRQVDIGVDREGGGDDLVLQFRHKRWQFKRIIRGESC